MSKETDTPRTDAVQFQKKPISITIENEMLRALSRQLERELLTIEPMENTTNQTNPTQHPTKGEKHNELKEVKTQLFWLKKYPQDDPEWSFSPISVIKKREKLQEREKELLDLLKS